MLPWEVVVVEPGILLLVASVDHAIAGWVSDVTVQLKVALLSWATDWVDGIITMSLGGGPAWETHIRTGIHYCRTTGSYTY